MQSHELKQVRTSLGLTQDTLAQTLNVTRQTINRYEQKIVPIPTTVELALMQLANNVTLSVYEAAWKSITPGMTNRHVSDLIGATYEHIGFPGEASCEVGQFSALPHGSLSAAMTRPAPTCPASLPPSADRAR